MLDAAGDGGDTALVAGSGLLLDVPIEPLAARFRRVLLADVVHLPAVVRRTRRWPDVEHVAVDLTGCLDAVHRTRRPVDPPAITAFLDDPRIDLVVSVNLLSQLPLVPCGFLERAGSTGLDAFSRALIERHLEWLRAFRARVCLVTDYERVYTTRDGSETEDALHGVRLPDGGREWTWALAPRGELARDVELTLRVRAVISA